jgi:hypothetical protein
LILRFPKPQSAFPISRNIIIVRPETSKPAVGREVTDTPGERGWMYILYMGQFGVQRYEKFGVRVVEFAGEEPFV